MSTPTASSTPTATSDKTSDSVADPQVSSWDGRHSMMFETGDYVMVASAAAGLQLHLRFCYQQIDAHAPYTCAVALQCSHSSGHVEIFPTRVSFTSDPSAFQIHEYSDELHGGLEVTCADTGLHVSLMRQRSHGQLHFDVRVRLPSASKSAQLSDLVGLAGSNDGVEHNDYMMRDGTLVNAERHLSADESIRFQKSWQVQPAERLFLTPFPSGDQPMHALTAEQHARHVTSQSELFLEGLRECSGAGVGRARVEVCASEWVASGRNVHHVANLVRFYDRYGY